jgi:hypothetical protein
MTRLLVSAAVAFGVVVPAQARAECALFSIDAACSASKKPELRVTFSGPSQRDLAPVAKEKPARREPASPQARMLDFPAIDCGLVRGPAPGTEYTARVITPHPDVTHSMRTVTVPVCRK